MTYSQIKNRELKVGDTVHVHNNPKDQTWKVKSVEYMTGYALAVCELLTGTWNSSKNAGRTAGFEKTWRMSNLTIVENKPKAIKVKVRRA